MKKEYKIQLDFIKENVYHYNIYFYVNDIEENKIFYAMDLNNPQWIIEQGYTKHPDSL